MKQGDSVRILAEADAVAQGEGAMTSGSPGRVLGRVYPGQLGLYVGPCVADYHGRDMHVVAIGSWDVALLRSDFVEEVTS